MQRFTEFRISGDLYITTSIVALSTAVNAVGDRIRLALPHTSPT